MHVERETEDADFQFSGGCRPAACHSHLVQSGFQRAQIDQDDQDRYHEYKREGPEPNPQPLRSLEALLRAGEERLRHWINSTLGVGEGHGSGSDVALMINSSADGAAEIA